MSQQRYDGPSEATAALVLGILTFPLPFLAPFAWFYGSREVKAIDAGLRDPSGRSGANAGRIIGMVGTLIALSILVFVVFFGIWAIFNAST